jgi:hypothetical protein
VTNPTSPTNTYRVPAASITSARTGISSKANELGTRTMPVRALLENTDNTLAYTHARFR